MERDVIHRLSADHSAISTHTLTWSVTRPLQPAAAAAFDFNSHAHVERDIENLVVPIVSRYFNSHAHVERDFDIAFKPADVNLFQLTRSRGA